MGKKIEKKVESEPAPVSATAPVPATATSAAKKGKKVVEQAAQATVEPAAPAAPAKKSKKAAEVAPVEPPVEKKIAKKKKEKKEKDPNAPKRPLSAYFFFAADVREQIKRDNPGAGPTVVATLIGQKWSATEEAARAKYVQAAADAKAAYDVEVAAYKASKA